MSKPKVYGSFRSFLPNNRADSRRRKVWEHNRRVAEREPGENRAARRELKRLEQEKGRLYASRSD